MESISAIRNRKKKPKKFSYEEARKKKEAKQHSKKAQVYQANEGEAPGKKKSRLKFGEGESVKTEKLLLSRKQEVQLPQHCTVRSAKMKMIMRR